MRKRLAFFAALLMALLLCCSAGCSITEIVTSMDAVGDSTFMYADSGSMYLWGDSSLCGGGSTVGGTVFDRVPGVVSMAFGDRFAVWLTRDGVAVSGSARCLPGGGTAETVEPTLLCTLNSTGLESSFAESYQLVETDLSSARQVAAGNNFWLALLDDGRLFGFGTEESVLQGERGGDGLVEVTGLPLLSRVSAASTGECAGVTPEGEAVLWGGSFGAPAIYAHAEFTMAESAGDFVLALDTEGSIWRLENGTGTRFAVADVTSVAAGEGFAMAVTRSGDLYSLGRNDHCQLGRDAGASDPEPGQVEGLSGVIAVSCGRAHSVALRKDGTLWAWGAGEAGQLGTGTADSVTPLKLPEKTAKVDIR